MKVHSYLATIDTPIPASQWRSLGEAGVEALEEIAHAKDTLPTRRARAVGAAGLIGGDRARCLAVDLVHEDPAPVVRQSAARALGEVLRPEELRSVLEPVLEKDASLGVRAAAAQVLTAKAPASCAAVRAQVGKELTSRRPAFSAALKRCSARR